MGVWRTGGRTEVLVGLVGHDEREREVRVDLAQVEHLRRLVLAAPVEPDHRMRVNVRYWVAAAAARARHRARGRASAELPAFTSTCTRVHMYKVHGTPLYPPLASSTSAHNSIVSHVYCTTRSRGRGEAENSRGAHERGGFEGAADAAYSVEMSSSVSIMSQQIS